MLRRRDLYSTPSGAIFRLLDISTKSGKPAEHAREKRHLVAHVIDIDDPKALPRQLPIAELQNIKPLPERKLKFRPRKVSEAKQAVGSAANDKSLATTSPAEKIGKERWALIEPLVANPQIYFRTHRGRLIAERAKATGTSDRTIMRALRKYWQGGMTSDALWGEFHLCGQNSESSSTNLVVGRRPVNNRYKKYRWEKALKAQVIAFIVKLYKNRLHTKTHCYEQVMSAFFSVGTGKDKVPLPKGEAPTLSQITYLLHKHISLEALLRREHGDDGFAMNVEPKTGSARMHAAYIGQYFELDATIPDVKVVDPDDRRVVIGKATLYVTVDAKSMLILGFFLCLDNASWDVAKEALLSISQDKEELCRQWGVEYCESDWPAHGAWPQILRVDRGPELTGYDSDQIAEGLEGIIENSPPCRAYLKAFVEFTFKFIHQRLRSVIGGYTPPEDFGKRQTEDLGKGATRTLQELGGEILRAIILWNRTAPKASKADASLAELRAGFKASPIEVWNRDIEESAGAQTSFDHDYLRFKLLPNSDDFLVTPSGVVYKNLRWVPPKNQAQKWLLPATVKSYRVRATFKRSLVDYIYVHDRQDPTVWTTMRLADSHTRFLGLTFAQAELRSNELLGINDTLEHHNLTEKIRHGDAAIERESVASRKKRDAAKDKKRGPKVDIVERREQLAREERRAEPVLETTSNATSEEGPGADMYSPVDASADSVRTFKSTKKNALLELLLKQSGDYEEN